MHAIAGFLVFVFVPLSMLTALVMMLRVLRESLPALAAGDAEGPQSRVAGHLSIVMLPFLAVYALSYMEWDWLMYVQGVVIDDQLSSDFDPAARLIATLNVESLGIVAIAVALKWAFGRWGWARRFRVLGFVLVYLEVIWLTLAAWVLIEARTSAWEWLQTRQIVGWSIDGWAAFVDQLGALASPVKAVVAGIGALLSTIEPVIVIPFAWLTVGAVIYGH